MYQAAVIRFCRVMMSMYHVTNVGESNPKPQWRGIRLCIPNDRTFDGSLRGLFVACFTTTRCNHGLPTISPYPRGAEKDKFHWRVEISFNLKKYNIFKMGGTETQVHLLCLSNKKTDTVEKHFAKILQLTSPKMELTPPDYEDCFPAKQANIYSGPGDYFVNVHFIRSVKIGADAKWDKVPKGPQSFGDCIPYSVETDPRELLVEWVQSHIIKVYGGLDVPENVYQHLKKLRDAIYI